MTVVLTLLVADLRRLAGYATADTSHDTDLTALATAEQPVVEYALDPLLLASTATNAGLKATMTLGVEEILAGRYLQQVARSPGMADDFVIGPIHVTASKTAGLLALAQQLTQIGVARLAPFGLAPNSSVGLAASSGSGAFGKGGGVVAVPGLLGQPPISTGGVASTTNNGLFGAVQGTAIGTDDSEPPAEFASGFVSYSDPNNLGES